MTPLSGTTKAKFFTVDYFVRCFVKHAAVFEVGPGDCVQFPIRVLSQPTSTEVNTKEESSTLNQNFIGSVAFDHENPGQVSHFFRHDSAVWADLPEPSQLPWI